MLNQVIKYDGQHDFGVITQSHGGKHQPCTVVAHSEAKHQGNRCSFPGLEYSPQPVAA